MPTLSSSLPALLNSPNGEDNWNVSEKLRFAKRLLWDAPINIAKGVGTTALELGQSGVTAMLAPSKLNLAKHYAELGNVVAMGIPKKLMEHYDEQQAKDPATPTPDRKILYGLESVGRTLWEDATGGKATSELLQKKLKTVDSQGNEISRPLTPEETADKLVEAGLKWLPWLGVAGRVIGSKPVELTPAGIVKPKYSRSVGEMAHAQGFTTDEYLSALKQGKVPKAKAGFGDATNAAEAVFKKNKKPTAEFPTEGLDEVSTQAMGVAKILSDVDVEPIVGEAYRTEIFRNLVRKKHKAKEGAQFTDVAAEAIAKGALSPETINNLATKFALLPENAAEVISKALRLTETVHGKGLNVIQRVQENAVAEALLAKDLFASKDAISYLRAMQEMTSRDLVKGGKVAKLANMLKQGIITEESLRRGIAVTQPKTTLRNIASQGINLTVVDTFEHLATGFLEYGKNTLEGRYQSPTKIFEDAITHWSTLLHNSPKSIRQLNEMLSYQPVLKESLLGTPTFETFQNMLGDIRAGVLPTDLKGYARATVDLLNAPNHFQEMAFRRLFYRTRLNVNLKSLGKTEADFLEALKGEALAPELRAASADAFVHSLKQTFALTPEFGLPFKPILDLYAKLPILTAVGPMYPRFLANKFSWLMERSPTHWFDLFAPEFRDRLWKAADGVDAFTSKTALRDLSKATSGLAMFAAAWAVRDSDVAGPKYYQLKAGKHKDEEGRTYDLIHDLRPYDPFTSMLFLVDLGKKGLEGLNLTSDETLDAVAGLRGMSNMPMFAFVDDIRNAYANKQGLGKGTEMLLLKRLANHVSAFLTPFQTSQDIQAALGSDEAAKRRDTNGETGLDPLIDRVQQGLGLPSSYPVRQDPIAGREVQNPYPKANLFGTNLTPVSKLNELIASTPGVKETDLLGQVATPIGRQLMNKYVDQILDGKNQNGFTLRRLIANYVDNPKLSPEEKRRILLEAFKEVRNEAKPAAIEEDRKTSPEITVNGRRMKIAINFLEDELSSLPSLEQEQARKELLALGVKFPQ